MKRILLAAILLAAQAITEVEITAEPHHHFTFENAYVRVFNLEVAPHADTLMHWHRHDYVYVVLGAAHVSSEVKGKAPVEIKFADGEARFLPATFAHIAHNLSDQPFRNVTIEYLQDAKLRAHPTKWDEERGLDILHGGTKEILFVNDGVRATEFELQPGGTAPMPANAFLLVAVSDLGLLAVDRPRNAPHNAWDLGDKKSGYSIWLPAGVLHALTNKGKHSAKFVTLEFP